MLRFVVGLMRRIQPVVASKSYILVPLLSDPGSELYCNDQTACKEKIKSMTSCSQVQVTLKRFRAHVQNVLRDA